MCNIRVSNNLRVSNAPLKLRAWCRRELELPNPDYEKKLRMNKWVGNTPKVIRLYELDGNDLILPYGCLESAMAECEPESLEYDPQMVNSPMCIGGDPVNLYDYQQSAVDWMYLIGGGVLQSPAGSGKTQMGIALIQKYCIKTLWITHTQDLLKQSYDRARQYIPEDYLGTITEGKINIGSWITFATVQTLSKIDIWEHKYEWGLVIVDECHRVAGSPTSVTMFYKVLNCLAARHKYGLSATMHRSDGLIKACTALVGNVGYTVPDSAVAERVMRVKIQSMKTGYKPSERSLNFDGTLNYNNMITEMCSDHDRTQYIVDNLVECQYDYTLVLSARVWHLKAMMEMLPDSVRDKAVMIDGSMVSKAAKQQRADAIEQMRTGEKHIMFATYQLAKEGLDIPRLNMLFMTTPQKDLAVIVQSIGRIARVHPQKDVAIAYDFVDDSAYCVKAYRKRCAIYRKQGCEFI